MLLTCGVEGELVIVSGSANPPLAAAIAREAQVELAERSIERFPDGEMRVELKTEVAGAEVFVVQPTGPPVADNVLELLLIADACRRSGAAAVNAVVPYFGYARADRRTREGQPLGARVLCDVLASQPFARSVAVDLHSAALETAFSSPLVHASGVPLLAKWLRTHARDEAVVVAPDLGAVKLARRYAHDLDLPLVVVHKSRTTGADVTIRGIVGDVRGARPILVDDMISTGATIVAAAAALLEAGCLPEVTVVATHGVLVGDAVERLRAVPGCRLVVTDSLYIRGPLPIPGEVVSLAPLLAEIVQRLFRRGSLRALGIPA